MILAIDFDGVVHDNLHPAPGHTMGPPIEGARSALWDLHTEGHKIIIHTIWANDERGQMVIKNWFDHFDIPFDAITNLKPRADAYIDDRGVRFTNWQDVIRFLHNV